MTVTIGSLTWIDTDDPGAPVADYVLNFAQDRLWQFNLAGSYHFQSILPTGILVDNSANANALTIQVGATSIGVPAFQRQNVPLPRGQSALTFSANAMFSVPIQFFRTSPAPDSLASYASNLASQQAAVTQLIRGAIAGFLFAAGSTTSWNISQGACTDQGNSTIMQLPAFSKNIGGPWAQGAGNGGLANAGFVAPGWLHAFVFLFNGQADIFYDTTVAANNMPPGGTVFRRVRSFFVDAAGHIVPDVQTANAADTILWATESVDFTGGGLGPGATTISVSTPPGVNCEAFGRVQVSSANNWGVAIFSPIIAAAVGIPTVEGPAGQSNSGTWRALTSATSLIEVVFGAAGTSITILTSGYVDTRGRFS